MEYKKFQSETQNLNIIPVGHPLHKSLIVMFSLTHDQVQNPLYISPEKEYKNVLYKEGRRRGRAIFQKN